MATLEPMTFLRQLRKVVSVVLVLSGLTLFLIQTSPVRRFALTKIRTYFREYTGLELHAQEFDYSLFSSNLVFKEVAVAGFSPDVGRVNLKARHVVLGISAWEVAQGSLESIHISIDGLNATLISSGDSATNRPATSPGWSNLRLPTISVVNSDIHLLDSGSGASMHLLNARLSAAWNSAKRENSITFGSSSGYVRWSQGRLPLNQVQLNAALGSSGFSLSSLNVVTDSSKAEVSGTVSGSPARIEAKGALHLDLHELTSTFGISGPAQGEIKVNLVATGPVQGTQLEGHFSSDHLLVQGTPITDVNAAALFDTETGRLRLVDFSGHAFSGQLTGNGNIQTKRGDLRSEFSARLAGLDPRVVARTFGSPIHYGPPATVEVTASWPGLEWRRFQLAGSAKSLSAAMKIRAAGDPKSVHANFQAALGDDTTAQGDITLALPTNTVSGQFDGNVGNVGALTHDLQRLVQTNQGDFPGSPAMRGTARWSATLRGTLQAPSVSMHAAVNRLSFGKYKDADLQLDANLAGGKVEVRRARLDWSGQQIEIKGLVGGLSADSPLQLAGTVAGSPFGVVFENLGLARVTDGRISGSVRVGGSVADPTAETSVEVTDLNLLGERFQRASVDAQWQNSELKVTRLEAEQKVGPEPPGRLDGSGTFNISTGQYTLSIKAQGLRATSGIHPVTGVFNLQAAGTGTLQNPGLSARFVGSEVRAGEILIGELRGEAEARDHRASGLLTAPALKIRLASTIAMQGDWPFEAKLDAENTLFNTNPSGSFDASIRGDGSVTAGGFEHVTAVIRNLRLATPGHETVSDGPIEISYADRQFQVDHLKLTSGDSNLSVTGTMPLGEGGAPGSVALQGKITLERLSRLFPEVQISNVKGVAQVNAKLTGNGRHWTPTGSITIEDGGFRQQSIPNGVENLAGRIVVEDSIIRIEQLGGKLGTGKFSIAGSLPLRLISPALPAPTNEAAQPARLSAQLDDLRFTTGQADKTTTASVAAKLDAEATALSLDALQATLDFSELRLRTPKSDFGQTAPTRVRIAGGVARLETLKAITTGGTLVASGSIDLKADHRIELDAVGDLRLADLEGLMAPLEGDGRIQLELHGGGTLVEPRFTGSVALQQASLSLAEPRLQAAELNVKASLAGDEIKLGEFSGLLNGGRITGDGDLKLTAGTLVSSTLQVNAKNVFLEYPAGLKTTSSLGLKLVLRNNQPTLEGKVEIQDGYWDAPFDTFGSRQSLDPSSISTQGRTADSLALDVSLVTKRPIEMNNNLGRLAALANLRLGGTVTQPRVVGDIQLEQDGRIYFGDRTYYIERGAVRFQNAPKVTPELDIHASTRAGSYTVNLGLTGQPKEITTTFTSDPPLPRDDVIAVLLTGRTISENPGVDIRSLEGYALASGAISASLSNRLNRKFGVSRVTIQPAAVAAESNPGARITFTQDFTNRFRMMYSMNLSDSNDQLWVTEYDLSRRFTTRAVKQSDNTYRGEFRHDVRFGSSLAQTFSASRPQIPTVSGVQFVGGEPFSSADLAKHFKIKTGHRTTGTNLRTASEKLGKFLVEKNYLESRIHVDRDDAGQGLNLTVRIELGPKVEMAYDGAGLSRKQKNRVRAVWHAGISNQQRTNSAKNSILDHLAEKGYLRAEVTFDESLRTDAKLVRFQLHPGIHFNSIKVDVQGAGEERAKDILTLLEQPDLRLSVYRDPRRTTAAIRRFYEQRGYLAATIAPPVHDLNEQKQSGKITIPITEGPVFRVGALEFTGNAALTADELRAGLPLKPGAVFEPARLEPASTALKLKYGKLGYGEVDIDYEIALNKERASVDMSFKVIENKQTTIGAVKVDGNRRTSTEFALRRMRVSSGEVANTALIRESARNLAQTGAYATADVQLLRAAVKTEAGETLAQVADLQVNLLEPKPFRLLYGGLYDSGGGPGFIADLQNHNSLGPGRTLGLRLRSDPDTSEARVYVTRPFWRNRRLSTTLSTYFTRRTEYHQNSPTSRLGVSLQQDLPLRSKWLVSYGYRYEKQRGFIPDPSAPEITADVVSVAPGIFTISRDARDSFLDATRGSFLSHGFEVAPKFLGSDYPYARYYLQYFKYFPLTRPRPVSYGEQPERSRLVFATGWRVGLQKGFGEGGAVLTDRFYAGGGTTVRGFGQDELGPKLENGQPAGGNAVLVLNNELRFRLFWIFDGVTFTDVGNVFPRVSDFSVSDLRGAGGFGLRIRNPFIVLRFDYGFKFGRRPGESVGAFFFSIGQAF